MVKYKRPVYDPNKKCQDYIFLGKMSVCGSDGRTYNYFRFECDKLDRYGENSTVRISHILPCFIWEEYGLSNATFFYLLLMGLIIFGVCLSIYRTKRSQNRSYYLNLSNESVLRPQMEETIF